MTPHPVTVYRHRTWHHTSSQYTDTGHGTAHYHSIQTQGMTPHIITVYRHRAWHRTLSQYTDTGHGTIHHHSIQTQDMAPHIITVYRYSTWHHTFSQYTDTGHDTPSCHSIQTQDMTLHPVTAYRHRTWHSTPSQHTDTAHDTPPVTAYRHRTWHSTLSKHTDTGHDTPPCQSIQTQDMTLHTAVTAYRHRTWHSTLSKHTDTGHDTPPCQSIQTQDITPLLTQYTDTGLGLPCHHVLTQDMTPRQVTVYRHRHDTWHHHSIQTLSPAFVVCWCWTSHVHWKPQLPVLMSLVRPETEILFPTYCTQSECSSSMLSCFNENLSKSFVLTFWSFIFQLVYREVANRIEAFREMIHNKLLELPTPLEEQKKFIRSVTGQRSNMCSAKV